MFITNKNKDINLKERLDQVIQKSQYVKFLVGFFYFSGLRELYEALKKNPGIQLNILVGLNVDKWNNDIIEWADPNNKKLSNKEIQNKFFASLKTSINSEKFDTADFYEQVKFFIEMIKNNQLIIRKTLNPNHAKLYIFRLSDTTIRETLFITGSSNLTRPGLITQDEFNVEISDYGAQEAEKYFDRLSNEAIPITESHECKDELIRVIEQETLIREITPFEAYALIIQMYLDAFKAKDNQSISDTLKDAGYAPYQYQLDAIQQALSIIEKYNGVILADVVGLGKTIIACAIARSMRKRGIIICPPGLVGDARKKDYGWNMYKEQFKLYDWEVYSLGQLEQLHNAMLENKYQDVEVIIVDEAHRFRNEDTKSYEYLKNICRGKQVILLTATPFNNRPSDIFSLLKLFTIPKKSTITLEDNLYIRFNDFENVFKTILYIKKHYNSSDPEKRQSAYIKYKLLFGEAFSMPDALRKLNDRAKYVARQLRDIIEPVTIRRNRLDLQKHPEYKKQILSISEVDEPKEWFFELTREQSMFYDRIIQYFNTPDEGGRFTGAIYKPYEYEVGAPPDKGDKLPFEYIQQNNLYNFMRRLIVRRFESSFGAFQQSILNFQRITNSVLIFIEKTGKYILDRDLLEKIYDKDIDEIEKYLEEYSNKITNGVYPKNHKIYDVNKFKEKEKFINDIQSDLKLFQEILSSIDRLDIVNQDPKIDKLIQEITQQLQNDPSRKIVIFSEYIDTVDYLKPKLENVFQNKILSISGNLSRQILNTIYTNFDASCPVHQQKNDYTIILTTDKLSEGFNLNRSGMVINYDIPWNPVRVIQRLGRINRIGKKVFDKLYIVNFFPTEKGAQEIQSREIAANKMFMIHNVLGEDAKIFDIDEEPSPSNLFKKIQQNPDTLEEESFYTRIMQEYQELEKNHPEVLQKLRNLPPRIKVAKQHNNSELLVFIKKKHLLFQYIPYDTTTNYTPQVITIEEAFDKIRCSYSTRSVPLSKTFWDAYTSVKTLHESTSKARSNENSIEQKAFNNLNTLLRDAAIQNKEFIETLLDDINHYGTLPDYTLRRIANINTKKPDGANKQISQLKQELGENYLAKEKATQASATREIIVAIENQKG